MYNEPDSDKTRRVNTQQKSISQSILSSYMILLKITADLQFNSVEKCQNHFVKTKGKQQ